MLKITLKPGETMIVNGALLRAEGRCELAVENKVSILRGREIMGQAEATSPSRRLYFAAMMAYVDPANGDAHRESLLALLEPLVSAFQSPLAKGCCAAFARQIASGDYYGALHTCRALIELEDRAMNAAVADAA